jgi:hypothetical protein
VLCSATQSDRAYHVLWSRRAVISHQTLQLSQIRSLKFITCSPKISKNNSLRLIYIDFFFFFFAAAYSSASVCTSAVVFVLELGERRVDSASNVVHCSVEAVSLGVQAFALMYDGSWRLKAEKNVLFSFDWNACKSIDVCGLKELSMNVRKVREALLRVILVPAAQRVYESRESRAS